MCVCVCEKTSQIEKDSAKFAVTKKPNSVYEKYWKAPKVYTYVYTDKKRSKIRQENGNGQKNRKRKM